MDDEGIRKLVKDSKGFPFICQAPEIEETHISYVILCENDVLKLKKSVKLDFLDFSTTDLRKHYCYEELHLNRRFAEAIYLDVLPVSITNGVYMVGNGDHIVDYAVHMKRMPSDRRMDILLDNNRLQYRSLDQLARILVDFH
ncbi:MAG: hypothetical protein P8X57_03965, partial [Cyclobacteriaceae bacterium]